MAAAAVWVPVVGAGAAADTWAACTRHHHRRAGRKVAHNARSRNTRPLLPAPSLLPAGTHRDLCQDHPPQASDTQGSKEGRRRVRIRAADTLASDIAVRPELVRPGSIADIADNRAEAEAEETVRAYRGAHGGARALRVLQVPEERIAAAEVGSTGPCNRAR